MEENRSFFSQITDHNTVVHKALSYGAALAFLLYSMFTTPGKGNLPANIGTTLVIFILYYTLLTQRVLETLIWAAFIGIAMLNGTGLLGAFQAQLYKTMGSEDFIWIVLMCGLLNVFNKLLGKTGSLGAFAGLIRKKVKDPKGLNLATWLLQFPLFFDDYMTIAVGGSIMAPIYDDYGVPREEGAFLIHTLAEPLRVLCPVTSWAAFLSGLFVSAKLVSKAEAMMAFFKSIPYSFYAMVSIVGTFLFAMGILPKIGSIRRPKRDEYRKFEDMEKDADKPHGRLIDFFLPIIALVAGAFICDFDVVPSLLVVVPATAFYYLLRGVVASNDIESCLVEGFGEFMSLFILFTATYMLNDILTDLDYVNYLAGVVKHSVNPHLLPAIVFVIFSLSEAVMSLNWGLLLIVFPIVIPVALTIGANPYLTAAAIISAGCFGCNFCYICDYTMLTSSVFGLKAGNHATDCLPYAVIFAVITALMYWGAGYIF